MTQNNKQKFSIIKQIKSFRFAFAGIKILFTHEHNARIHLVAAILVVVAGFMFDISHSEWLAVIIVIGLVTVAETFNTALEYLANFVNPDIHPKIKVIKDLSAAAVFLSAVTAFVVGLVVFLPKII